MYPKSFSHIGISVEKIEEVVKWYNKVLGFYIIMPVTEVVNENKTAIGIMCQDVFGENFETFKIAHMSTYDRIGIELSEFPSDEKYKFDPKKLGVFHFSIQAPDIEGLVQKIIENGGRQRMPIREYYPNNKPYRMCYVEDPWGQVFEIYSHSYELHYSVGKYN